MLNDRHIELLTQDSLAAELKMRPQSLADWRHRGKGPDYVKLGQLVRYRRSDVQRWLEGQTVSHEMGGARRMPENAARDPSSSDRATQHS